MHAIGLVLLGLSSCFGLMLRSMSCFGTLLGRPPGFFCARDRRAAALMARLTMLAILLAFW